MSSDPYNGKVVLAQRGLIGSGWCCAPKSMSQEEVQLAVHRYLEPYIPDLGDGEVAPWTVVKRTHAEENKVSPGRCDEHPDRQHWFMLGGVSGIFLMALGGDEEHGLDPEQTLQTQEDYEAARATVN